MSYDIRFAVRGEPKEMMYVVFEPDVAHPTYNIGNMLRAAMDWDFEQGEWYRFSAVRPHIEKGLEALRNDPDAFRRYEPENHWGSVEGAIDALESILKAVDERCTGGGYDWNEYDPQYLWICW